MTNCDFIGQNSNDKKRCSERKEYKLIILVLKNIISLIQINLDEYISHKNGIAAL